MVWLKDLGECNMSANKFTLDGLESFELEQKGRFSCCFSYRALVLEATALTTEPQPLPISRLYVHIFYYSLCSSTNQVSNPRLYDREALRYPKLKQNMKFLSLLVTLDKTSLLLNNGLP